MLSLIRFELEKIFQKRLVIITLLGMILFTYIMISSWVAPSYSSLIIEENGSLVTQKGRNAILLNQEICAKFAGPLTDEKVQQVLEEYQWSQSAIDNSDFKVKNIIHYTHNLMYNAFTKQGFTDDEGNYNGSIITERYGDLAPELTVGYFEGWENTLYALSFIILVWGCVVIILLSPIFSEEYTQGTDALLLTGVTGKTKCSSAKLIASFIVALTGTLLLLFSATLALLLYHGTAGFDASVQITHFGFLAFTPYVLSWGSAYGFACLLWICSIIALSAVTLLISAVAKTSFSALVLSFAVYVIPMFTPWSEWNLHAAGAFFPGNQLRLTSLFHIDLLQLGNFTFPIMWLTIPIAALLLILGIFLSKKIFSEHQVV